MQADLALRAAPTSATARDLERARGRLSLAVRAVDGRNAIADLGQAGCGRLLFPVRPADAPLEAVVVNTGGGLTGGDRFRVTVEAGPGAEVTLTTQACEKVYAAARSADGLSALPARVSTRLTLGRGAVLRWLPQETILFEGSALARTLGVDMAEDADFLAVEALLLGRQAMGETVSRAAFRDSWRIRRGGRLVFAEELAAGGHAPWARLRAAPSLLGGETVALATILHVSPRAGEGLDESRAIMEQEGVEGGVTAFDGLCVMRLAASSGLRLRRALTALIEGRSGGVLPRVWST
jgi:urease accessory protein